MNKTYSWQKLAHGRVKYLFGALLLACLLQGTEALAQKKASPKTGISQQANAPKRVKNIIFLIGDGMGVSQVYAGYTQNKGRLNLELFKHIGFSKTTSADSYITDSAAGATAFSIGEKTNNYYVGLDALKVAKPTILEIAEKNGKATGLVATCSITHATPASFIAHVDSRKKQDEIAAQFLNTDIDVFIGGGFKYFAKREDGRNLIEELQAKNYVVAEDIESLKGVKKGKVAGLVAFEHPPAIHEGRDTNFAVITAMKAIELLQQNPKGFFLMIEGSQIDWGGHANDAQYIGNEMVDFDRVIGAVLEFAKKDKETLVVITADHETGGFSLPAGDLTTGEFKGTFTTKNHTGVMVPVFAYGPYAEEFMGIYENNEIFHKMMKAYGFKKP